MNFIKHYLTVAILLLSLQSFAQIKDKDPDNSQFTRLYIGDTVPMESIVFSNVRNYPGGKAKLSDFRGKYVILDFWDKGCSSCIAAFPRMEELQNQFKDDIQILLVTKDLEKDLSLLSENSTNLRNTKLPVVIGEQILTRKLFPHKSVPFHVWLDKKGKVIATTYSSETNSKNLKNLTEGKPLNLLISNEILSRDEPIVKELNNSKLSLLNVRNGFFLKQLKYYAKIPTSRLLDEPMPSSSIPSLPYYSLFVDYIPGDIGQTVDIQFQDEYGKNKGFKIFNWTLQDFYRKAYVEPGMRVLYDKFIIEGKAKQLYPSITDTTNLKRYFVNNSYCYESCLPHYTYEGAKKLLQQDLMRFFGMMGSIEERSLKCLVLTRLGDVNEKKLWMKNQKWMKNINAPERAYINEVIKVKDGWKIRGGVNRLFTELEIANRAIDDPVIINETNFSVQERTGKKVDVHLNIENFHCTIENIPRIREQLAKYGLGFKEENRMMKVLVLRSVL